MTRARYTYRVVTHNGAGIHSREFRSLPKAREVCREIAARDDETLKRIGYTDEFEIERILEVRRGGYRYWMRSGERWELWDPNRGPDIREPDFLIRAGAEQ